MNGMQKTVYGISSLIIALFRAWSLYFYQREQACALDQAGNIVLFILRTLFYAFLFFIFFVMMQNFFMNCHPRAAFFTQNRPIVSSGKGFFIYCAILSVAWLPHIILKYPGAMCWDSWQMLTQYRGQCITNFHSPYYTVLFGFFTDLFIKDGHAEYGLFLFALVHYFIFVFVFGYSLWLLRFRMMANRALVIIMLLCYSLNPYIIGYLGVITKDSFYSVFVFLFILVILDNALDHVAFKKSLGKTLLLVISVINVCLVRRNGVFVILATCACLLFQSFRKKENIRIILVISISLGIAFLSSSMIKNKWSVENAGSRDAFSMCFQQTARYIKTYPDEITDEEADIIRAVLPYEELSYLYDPRISDPVKSHYNPTSMDATRSWLKLWAKWFFRHPGCYFSAVMEQNYYLFIPEIMDNISLYRDVNTGYELGKKIIISEQTPFFEPIFNEPEVLQGAKEAVVREYMFLHQVPVIRWLGNIPFYYYILLFISVFASANRIPWFSVFMPELITICIVIISPVIYGHPRYMFPVIYGTPILLVYTLFTAYSLGKKDCRNASPC